MKKKFIQPLFFIFLVTTLIFNFSCNFISTWFNTPKLTVALSINCGAMFTASKNVFLTISTNDVSNRVCDMRLANFSDFPGSQWEDYQTNKDWTLTEGDGEKTVYIQVRDKAGNVSDTVQATIILKADLPDYNILINNGDDYTNNRQVTLSLSAYNTGISTDVTRMYLANEAVFPGGNGYAYTNSVSWTLGNDDGEHTVYVWFEDSTGKRGRPCSEHIILDTLPLSGSVVDAIFSNSVFCMSLAGGYIMEGHARGEVKIQTDGTGSPVDKLILNGYSCIPVGFGREYVSEEVPASSSFSWDYFDYLFELMVLDTTTGTLVDRSTYGISMIIVDKAGNRSTPLTWEKVESRPTIAKI